MLLQKLIFHLYVPVVLVAAGKPDCKLHGFFLSSILRFGRLRSFGFPRLGRLWGRNNFNPLDAIQKGEFTDVAEDICYLLQVCRHKLETNNYDELETEIRKANDLNGQLSHLKREELQRIQSQSGHL